MFEPKGKIDPEKKFSDSELSNLRNAVLKWVEDKKDIKVLPKISAKIKPLIKPMAKPVVKPVVRPIKIAVKPKIVPFKTVLTAPKFKPVVIKNIKKITPIINQPPKVKPVMSLLGPVKKKNHHWILKIILVLIIILILAFTALTTWFYKYQPATASAKAITKIIPYPIAMVGWQPLYYYDWLNQVESLEQFYTKEQAQSPEFVPPSPVETKKHILDKMIEEAIVQKLAKKYQIEVTTKEMEDQIVSLAQGFNGLEAFERELQNLYSWDIEEFKKSVLYPLMLKDEVSLAIMSDETSNQAAKIKAEEVLAEVKQGDKTFEAIAQSVSEDVTSVQGGDLGYFSKGQMVQEFEDATWSLETGQVSELVKTSFGWHIIKVEDQLKDDNGEVIQIRARHILIKGKNIETYIAEIKNQTRIINFIKL